MLARYDLKKKNYEDEMSKKYLKLGLISKIDVCVHLQFIVLRHLQPPFYKRALCWR